MCWNKIYKDYILSWLSFLYLIKTPHCCPCFSKTSKTPDKILSKLSCVHSKRYFAEPTLAKLSTYLAKAKVELFCVQSKNIFSNRNIQQKWMDPSWSFDTWRRWNCEGSTAPGATWVGWISKFSNGAFLIGNGQTKVWWPGKHIIRFVIKPENVSFKGIVPHWNKIPPPPILFKVRICIFRALRTF